MNIHFVLTTFTPAMFGSSATAHLRVITKEEAVKLVDDRTRIVATKGTHEDLARGLLPGVARDVARYANLGAGQNAIHVGYRGPPLDESGAVPIGGQTTFTLIEVEDYQTP